MLNSNWRTPTRKCSAAEARLRLESTGTLFTERVPGRDEAPTSACHSVRPAVTAPDLRVDPDIHQHDSLAALV